MAFKGKMKLYLLKNEEHEDCLLLSDLTYRNVLHLKFYESERCFCFVLFIYQDVNSLL